MMGVRRLFGFTPGVLALGLVLATGHAAFAVENLSVTTTGKASSGLWPLYIAQAEGFFKDNGLDVDVISTQSTASEIEQVAAGSSVMGVDAGLTDPLRAIDKGAKIALLRSQEIVPPYTLWGKPKIKTFADLRGKTVIVGGAKDITRIYFDHMVKPNGLKPSDYSLVYAGSTPARYAALSSGAVDAAILLPPFSFKAQDEGDALIGRLADYIKDMPFTGMVVSTAWAQTHKPTIIGFLKGFNKGVDWFYDVKNRDKAISIFMKVSMSSQSDAAKSYDYLKAIQVYSRLGVIDASTIAPLVNALAAEGDISGSTDPSQFIDPKISDLARQAK